MSEHDQYEVEHSDVLVEQPEENEISENVEQHQIVEPQPNNVYEYPQEAPKKPRRKMTKPKTEKQLAAFRERCIGTRMKNIAKRKEELAEMKTQLKEKVKSIKEEAKDAALIAMLKQLLGVDPHRALSNYISEEKRQQEKRKDNIDVSEEVAETDSVSESQYETESVAESVADSQYTEEKPEQNNRMDYMERFRMEQFLASMRTRDETRRSEMTGGAPVKPAAQPGVKGLLIF